VTKPRGVLIDLGANRMRSNNAPSLRGTESLLTHRWREVDSNFQFRAETGLGFRLLNDDQCASASCPRR
jgi:hypothetical protein